MAPGDGNQRRLDSPAVAGGPANHEREGLGALDQSWLIGREYRRYYRRYGLHYIQSGRRGANAINRQRVCTVRNNGERRSARVRHVPHGVTAVVR